LNLIKGSGYKGVTDLEHAIAGNPSRVFVRFYLRIASGQVQNIGSFAHAVFLNTASSAEIALDFRRCGEVNGGYFDCNNGTHLLAIHSYSPEVWIANNQKARGVRDYFIWENHENEWVCVEWMVDLGNDLTSLWINGEPHVIDFPMDFSSSSASSVIFSGFTQSTSGEINYYYDDIIVSTSYIGPKGEIQDQDTTSPEVSGFQPTNNATNVSQDTNIVANILDGGEGVDRDSIQMTVNGSVVSPTITGSPQNYTLTYDPSHSFDLGQTVSVSINAQDLNSPPNIMTEARYRFSIDGIKSPSNLRVVAVP
jgi:hypothetical protein